MESEPEPVQPESPEALHKLGNAHFEDGRLEEGLACWRRAVELRPGDAGLNYDLGCAFHQLGRLDEAAPCYERALALEPDRLEALNNLGELRREQRRFGEAASLLQRALTIRPDFVSALCNLGTVRRDEGRTDEAIALYEKALALEPDTASAHSAKGMALRALGRLDEAVAACAEAVTQDPEFAVAHLNMGTALRDLGRYEEAIACYERALALDPGSAGAQINDAMCRLVLGDLATGWAKYEWRLRLPGGSPPVALKMPRWTGLESLEGKTLFLHAEQGLGDTIQFCRYVMVLAHRGCEVLLAVPQPLATLLSRLPGLTRILTLGDAVPEADYHSPLPSLPLVMGTRLATIPSATVYLAATPTHLEKWRARLGASPRRRVGLAWSGNPRHDNDRNRSIALERLLPLLDVGFEVVALQKDLRPADREVIEKSGAIRHFGEELGDFEDTAALASLMDVVVSVDTSIAHLAAALGRPTWLMLPFVPDWRWLLDRADSPWYPTVRLFRQKRIGDWGPVVEDVRRALHNLHTRGPS
ncbi:MAG TPA: tetratricopeptide repeat-containing glycosyltransferase family protein [Stellaceae bacterium]|nr:tetratricopeptide repeat-containing glycosyltransferase family protein [Stellaceae bacterium]